jgi:hypothetical protein
LFRIVLPMRLLKQSKFLVANFYYFYFTYLFLRNADIKLAFDVRKFEKLQDGTVEVNSTIRPCSHLSSSFLIPMLSFAYSNTDIWG